MVKVIIFDLDGPILDSLESSLRGVEMGIKELIRMGVSRERAALNNENRFKYWGLPGKIILKMMFPLLTGDELSVINNCWVRNERRKKIPLVEGSLKTLRWLKKNGFFSALLTSRSRNLQFHLKDYPLDKLFVMVQSRKNPEESEKIHCNHVFCKHHKPNPKALSAVLKWAAQNGITKKEIIMIDDTLVGLETAKSGGLKFLGVCTGPLNSKAKWRRYGNLEAKYVINSVAELPSWLTKYEGA